jgi:hypothetical protein
MSIIRDKYEEKCRTPSDINEHLPTLLKYAKQCGHITEMGVRSIVSTWALLEGAPKRMVSIDLNHPSATGGNLQEVYDGANQAGIDFKFLQASSIEVRIEPTDLLFIDTWHVYEQLKSELERHAKKVGKYIILHDTETFCKKGETEGHLGLCAALGDFLMDPSCEWIVVEHFKNNNGLTVLGRKNAS